jgi:transcriptional regulator with XRE-family HTH domain
VAIIGEVSNVAERHSWTRTVAPPASCFLGLWSPEASILPSTLHRRCGLHRTFIGSVERGEHKVSVLNLRTIAQTLRVPLSALQAEGAEGGEEGE